MEIFGMARRESKDESINYLSDVAGCV